MPSRHLRQAGLSPNGQHIAGVRRDGTDYWLVVADLKDKPLKWTGTKFEDLIIDENILGER